MWLQMTGALALLSSELDRGSEVDEGLAHWLLLLEIPGSIPAGGEEDLLVRTRFIRVICRDDDTVRHPSDQDFNWSPPVQGQLSRVQVKDPYIGSILMHVGSSCKHTGVYNVHLPRIIRN